MQILRRLFIPAALALGTVGCSEKSYSCVNAEDGRTGIFRAASGAQPDQLLLFELDNEGKIAATVMAEREPMNHRAARSAMDYFCKTGDVPRLGYLLEENYRPGTPNGL